MPGLQAADQLVFHFRRIVIIGLQIQQVAEEYGSLGLGQPAVPGGLAGLVEA